MITQKQVKELFDYDPKTGNLYRKTRSSNRVQIGALAGVVGKRGYKYVTIRYKKQYVHRIIFLMHKGYLPKYIDHKDTDRLNNKIENLRAASSNQNSENSQMRKDNTSGYKGVYKRNGKWCAKINHNGKQIHLGTFIKIKDANLCAIEGRNIYHKEFSIMPSHDNVNPLLQSNV